MIKSLLLIMFLAANASAGAYYENYLSTGTGRQYMKIAGKLCMAASSATPSTCTIDIEGSSGKVDGYDISSQFSAVAVSSNTLQSNINAEAATRLAQDNAIAVATTTLGSDLDDEISARYSQDLAIAVATTTHGQQIQDLYSVKASSGVNNDITQLKQSVSATASGSGTYSIITSSGIHVQAGGIKWPDGTTSTTAVIQAAAAGAVTVITTTFTVREMPPEAVDGINDTFTLSSSPVLGSESVYVNGILRNSGAAEDYTISNNTIVFNAGAIPSSGSKLLVTYFRDYSQAVPAAPWKRVLSIEYDPISGEIRLTYED